MESLLQQIGICIEKGKATRANVYPAELKDLPGVVELTEEALKSGMPPNLILNNGLLAGMKVVGEKFKDGKIFLPEVLIAAKAMNAAMEILKPYFLSGEIKLKGKIILGTVEGDLHDIGKNIVKMVLEGGGWQVIDLGTNVSSQKFIDSIKEHKVKVVGLSALLSTTMQNMAGIVKNIKSHYPDVVIVLGGAPLTSSFAESINADYYFPDPQGFLDYLNSNFFE